MDQVNAIVKLDVSRLNFPLVPFYARQLHSVVAEIVGAPADVTGVGIRLYTPSGGYYLAPCNPRPNGNWRVRIPALYFPEVGAARYEVFGTDYTGDSTALGSGEVLVGEFGTDTPAEIAGGVLPTLTISDEYGAQHRIVAVKVDDEWTWRIEE